MKTDYKLLLVGNPNVGKTTVFNYLTHSDNHTGNWHGVTVESSGKVIKHKDKNLEIIDLPGIYSLTVDAGEEVVSRDKILSKDYDCIIYISEVNNLPRNMYLLLQLMELRVPIVLVINMVDELKKLGRYINYHFLEEELGLHVIPIANRYHSDYHYLLDIALEHVGVLPKKTKVLDYLDALPLKNVEEVLGASPEKAGLDKRFCAIKVCENDKNITSKLELNQTQQEVLEGYATGEEEICSLRYQKIDSLTEKAVSDTKGNYAHGSSRFDKILLNKFLALPLFLLIMCGVFLITFGTVGALISDGLSYLIGLLAGAVEGGLNNTGVPVWINALVTDGVIGGVGGILTFLPQILLLFIFLAVLEDSGYMARVAFMTDGIFRRLGLSGKSSFTMVMGFGCSATAVITAKNLEDPKIKLKTVLLTPYMSCSARLPVYATLGGLFFLGTQPLLIFGLYLIGIAVALLMAFVFNKFERLKTVNTNFIMEMPPYRVPALKRVFKLIWANAKAFLIRVGTLIFAVNVIVWILANFSFASGFTGDGTDSILAGIASLLAVLFVPLGFGNWKAATAVLSGLIAKEVVVSTLQSFGDIQAIFNNSSAAAFSFLIFVLLYIPCVATLSAVSKEAGRKWAAFSFGLHLAVAYVFSLAAYWLAVFFTVNEPGVIIGVVIISVILLAVAIILYNIIKKRKCCDCIGCPHINSCGKKSNKK